jgi:hypothetical protein
MLSTFFSGVVYRAVVKKPAAGEPLGQTFENPPPASTYSASSSKPAKSVFDSQAKETHVPQEALTFLGTGISFAATLFSFK